MLFCKSSNRLKKFDDNIKNQSIEILEKKLNIIAAKRGDMAQRAVKISK